MVKANLGLATGIATLLSGVAMIAMVEPANAQSLSNLTVTRLNTSNLVAKQVLATTQFKPLTTPVASVATSSAAATAFSSIAASSSAPPPTVSITAVNIAPNALTNPPQGTTSAPVNAATVGFAAGINASQLQQLPQQPASPTGGASSPVVSGFLTGTGFQLGPVNTTTTTTTTTGGGGTGGINGVLGSQLNTNNLAGSEMAPPTQPSNWTVDSYHPPQGSTGAGQNQNVASGGEVNQNSSGAGGGNPGGGNSGGGAGLGSSPGGGTGSGTGNSGGGSNSGSSSTASNSGSGGQTTVASLDTSRGGDGGRPGCSNPDASGSCSPEGLANVAPTAGGSEYIVTATVAQAGDVSAGTYTFGTNADGSPRVMQTTPIVPKTVDAAGLNNVIARSSADHSVVAGTVSQIASADGAKRVAVDLYGDKLMSFAVDQSAATNIVDGDGKAIAQSGEGSDGKPVMMMASVAEQVVQSAINLGGLHQANGYLIRDGKLVLVYLEPGQHLAALPESAPQPTQIAMRAD